MVKREKIWEYEEVQWTGTTYKILFATRFLYDEYKSVVITIKEGTLAHSPN